MAPWYPRDVAGSYPRALTLPLGTSDTPVAPAIFFWKMAVFKNGSQQAGSFHRLLSVGAKP